MILKKVLNGSNIKWVSIIALALSLILFVKAQGEDDGIKTTKIENLEKADVEIKEDLKAVEEDIQQIQLDINTIQSDVGYTKDDMAEIKEDNKEIIKLLLEIKNK